MPFSLPRRICCLGLAALALGGCVPNPHLVAVAEGDDPSSLAKLPLRVLALQGVASVHRALESRLLLPVQVRAVPGNGSVPAVAQSLWPYLRPGQSVDVVLAPMAVLEQLAAQGYVDRDSLHELVSSPFAALVQEGRPVPDVSTLQGVRDMLRRSRALAYPSSDGSAYIEQSLLPQLGIKTEVMRKSIKVFGPQVAQLVARGDVDVGIQSMAELQDAPGITIAGELPAPLDYASVYGVALASHGTTPEGARALLNFYLREVPEHNWRGTGWQSVVPEAVDPYDKYDSEAYRSR